MRCCDYIPQTCIIGSAVHPTEQVLWSVCFSRNSPLAQQTREIQPSLAPPEEQRRALRISTQFMPLRLALSHLACSPFCPIPGSPFSPFCCRVWAWTPGMRLAGISPRDGQAEHGSPCTTVQTVQSCIQKCFSSVAKLLLKCN